MPRCLWGWGAQDHYWTAEGETQDRSQRRREAGRVSRKLALLRVHGLIKKIPRTHRYLLTENGVKAISAILAARQASVAQLAAA